MSTSTAVLVKEKFHTKMMGKFAKKKNNFVFSPLSIATAFELVKIAAEGKTKEEIQDLFGNLPEINIPEDFNLKIANSIWTVETPSKEYVEECSEKLNATAHQIKRGDGTPINKWCAEQTNGLIKSIVDDNLDNTIEVVLVNAVYFLAEWMDKFDKSVTQKDGTFTLLGGEKIEVPLMKKFNGSCDFYEDRKAKYVCLNYASDKSVKFSPQMVLALPTREEDIIEFVSEWDPIASSSKAFNHDYSILSFPRFTLEWQLDLKSTLIDLGLSKIFSNDSEVFKILINNERLKVDFVNHKAVIKVDEEGTEAAAVTAMGMVRCASFMPPSRKFSFIADRPFAFAIIDEFSETVLFMGTVFNPIK